MVFNSWFSAGVLGLAGVLFLVGGALACGVRALRYAPLEQRPLVTALLASVAAFVILGMGEPILFVRYGWFPSALLIAIRANQRRAQLERGSTA
jgi:hypothetical protein